MKKLWWLALAGAGAFGIYWLLKKKASVKALYSPTSGVLNVSFEHFTPGALVQFYIDSTNYDSWGSMGADSTGAGARTMSANLITAGHHELIASDGKKTASTTFVK